MNEFNIKLHKKDSTLMGMTKKYLIAYIRFLEYKLHKLDDAKPVIHAHWIENIWCSNCGGFNEDDNGSIVESFSEYCPNCGAIMDEEV